MRLIRAIGNSLSNKLNVKTVSDKKLKLRKKGGKVLYAKANKNDLQESFDKYYEKACEELDAEEVKIEDHDESEVIMYDKNGDYHGL